MRYKIQINVFQVDGNGDETYLFGLANEQERLSDVVQMGYAGMRAFSAAHRTDESQGAVPAADDDNTGRQF